MNLYYSFLNLLFLISIATFLRHSGYRSVYFFQMFQQHGYKIREFSGWISDHFYSRFFLPEHVLFLIVHFSILLLMSNRLTISAATLVLTMFSLFWFGPAGRFKPEKEKKPLVYTPRMKRLAATHAVLMLFFLFMLFDLAFTGRFTERTAPVPGSHLLLGDPFFLLFGLIVLDISVPLLVMLSAGIMAPVERRIREGFKKKAREKLSQLSGLKIVAVTGSYGKTSTKYMIHDLLKERYSVCMTPGSYNTPMGICKVINNDLDASHQILILEMGSRYEGNIRELCRIARPDVAVITNVGKAHLETFGSVDAVAKEKSTLARELKSGGSLVLNADDERVAGMKELHKGHVVLAGIENGAVRAAGIGYDENGTHFTLRIQPGGAGSEGAGPAAAGTVEQPVEMALLGAHNVLNFALSAAVADLFGIRPETMALAARKMKPVEHRLEMKKWGGLTVIDDAFNSNPVGAKNALEILSSFPNGRKIIITPGMVELGELQEEENRRFGNRISEAGLDLVILVGKEQTRPILEGIRQSGREAGEVRVVSSLFEANELVKAWARDGDVVLYENDLPDTYTE